MYRTALKSILLTGLVLFSATSVAASQSAQSTKPAICHDQLKPVMVDGAPQSKTVGVALLAESEPAEIELKASLRTNYRTNEQQPHYEIWLHGQHIGSVWVDDRGCVLHDYPAEPYIAALRWTQGFVSEGFGATLNQIYARKRYRLVEWAAFEENHLLIASDLNAKDFAAIEQVAEIHMMDREELEPNSFEYFREVACLADGTCYYSCHANEKQHPGSRSRIRRQHYFRLTTDGRFTRIVESQNTYRATSELRIAGIIAQLVAMGEDPRAAFPLLQFRRFGPNRLGMNYFQSQDGRFFVESDWYRSYEFAAYPSVEWVIDEWAKRCVSHSFNVGLDSLSVLEESDGWTVASDSVRDRLGALALRQMSQFTVSPRDGYVDLIASETSYNMPYIPEPPTQAQPEDFFGELESPAVPMDSNTVVWDENITGSNKARIQGWLADALDRVYRFSPDRATILSAGDEFKVFAPGSTFRLFILGSLSPWMFNMALTNGLEVTDPDKRPFDAITQVGYERYPEAPRTVDTVVIFDWIFWDGEQPNSAELIEAKLTAILAHEIIGNADHVMQASYSSLEAKRASKSENARYEVHAFDTGIALLENYMASDEFGSRSDNVKRAYQEVLAEEHRLRKGWASQITAGK